MNKKLIISCLILLISVLILSLVSSQSTERICKQQKVQILKENRQNCLDSYKNSTKDCKNTLNLCKKSATNRTQMLLCPQAYNSCVQLNKETKRSCDKAANDQYKKDIILCKNNNHICPTVICSLDDCPSGCEVKDGCITGMCSPTPDSEKHFCNIEHILPCPLIYNPVCGFYNTQIQCINPPCTKTYSNSCFACNDNNLEYFTIGECKQVEFFED